jgi:DNA-binding transcriptional LysR family regulator
MDLRQAEYVVAVADEGSFTRAAASIPVSQPSLSQGIRTLESELGVELFHRLGRKVALTAAGEAFLGPARQLLRDAATAREAAASVAGLRSGRLDLVALPTLAVDPLVGLVGKFRSQHPEVTVRIAEPEAADAAVELVRDGTCEVGLVELPASGGLTAHPLLDQEVVAVCAPGTRLDRDHRLPIRRLAEMPLIATPPGTSTRRLIDDALAAARVEPTVAVETSHREALLPLVLAGAGTTFLPEQLAHLAAQRGAVVARLRPAVHRTVGLVHRGGVLSPAAAAFVALALPTVRTPRDT